MNYVVGAIKFILATIFSISIIIVAVNYLQENTTDKTIAVAVICAVGFVYVHYLISTGISNISKRSYKFGLIFWAGLIVQFLATGGCLYWGITSNASIFLTTMFFNIFGIIVCAYDFIIIFKRLKAKRAH
jgi:hypothetical protein